MKIQCKDSSGCFLLIFEDEPGEMIRLPENISNPDLIFLIQGALDKLRPVLLLRSLEDLPTDKLINEMKKHHFYSPSAQVLFLNFSIRNQLVNINSSIENLRNFDEMSRVLNEYFANSKK